MSRISRGLLIAGVLFFLAGCAQKMVDQPRYSALDPSSYFPNGQSAQPLMPDTVSRAPIQGDTPLTTGALNNKDITYFPIPITREMLTRGQERYDIFCAVCHDRVGTGNGQVVQRGYTKPPSFQTADMRNTPVGHIFDAMTRGFGNMPSYAKQIPVADRWAIVAYVRALQLSQDAPLSSLSPTEQQIVQGTK